MQRSTDLSFKQRWDDICTQCGACCYQRDRVGGELVIHKELPCRFLDTDSQLCTVYDTRLQTCVECKRVTIFHALFSRYLPDDCGYVERFRKWRRLSRGTPLWRRRTADMQSTPEGPRERRR